ncbi:hypothetical protein [Maricaulis sp. CAU 1757]
MRILTVAAALALAPAALMSAAPALAQSCDAEPVFAAHRTANGVVRAQYNAVTRGEWPEAIHFGEEVAASGMSPVHKRAAWANLCAAYAGSGELDQAAEACATALELDDDNWRALNNRGVVAWLNGDRDSAVASFEAAEAASSGEDEVAANLALAQCG